MTQVSFYPIGTVNTPWGAAERQAWLASCQIKRAYKDVLDEISQLGADFDLINYGALSIDVERYPLWAIKSRHWQADKPCVLITGGVHGYETSGVHGALAFAAEHGLSYGTQVNWLMFPCISPWGYETINRWAPNAVDPNRSFSQDSHSEEAKAVMALLAQLGHEFTMHIDLHETTDTDESEFRPALAARDGKNTEPGTIPDGFYLVGDSENPQPDFQAAIIQAVRAVTHIAPSDEHGQIIGADVVQPGVINYPVKSLGLCAGVTNSLFCTTTEVYPDSPTATALECNQAQAAAVKAAIDFVLARR
ncbi:MAG: M14 family metallopeptidase [Shewanella sp.]